MVNQHPIHPDNIHHIGNGGYGHAIEQQPEIKTGSGTGICKAFPDRHQQKESHARTTELAIGKTAIRTGRIEQGKSGRQLRFRQMVIADNQIKAERTRGFARFKTGCTGIDTDTEHHPFGHRSAHRFHADAVAIVGAVRN